ncbi:MAG TPA: hypothetical protein EYH08_07515 [Pyrodictium sp.]|nr:hypothetical protein [Pyrodictium sp.]
MRGNEFVLQEKTTTLILIVLVSAMFILAIIDKVSEVIRILLLVSLILFAVTQLIVSRVK